VDAVGKQQLKRVKQVKPLIMNNFFKMHVVAYMTVVSIKANVQHLYDGGNYMYTVVSFDQYVDIGTSMSTVQPSGPQRYRDII